ncbi:aromatic acid exporter family protein [Alteribacillus sp. YIM 98480]|uniref:aromatic acid exporter family protein n=1 Tax=Alteribacillus sp. YIM 98480 TaxID=2606599 RepID=UPI00131BBE30|nr:aromatic acid exporter family protein [Alteribacillus sp. YIM 98480]
MKRLPFAGNRVIKTGVAILITAWICQLLNWPPVFAVITAIVTLEPTVSDSIKKGIIRLPASALGSFYAVLFIYFFDHSPLTYALAAVFTIATCVKLKLHAGLLVATLTAVAMVEVLHDNYFISFLIRLGTTTIGLLVSTAVNMFILPPDYTQDIIQNINKMAQNTGTAIDKVFRKALEKDQKDVSSQKELMDQLDKKLHKTESLVRYQKEESKFHPLASNERDLFHLAQYQLIRLRLIRYHMDNLLNTPLETISWSAEERTVIMQAVRHLAESMKSDTYYDQPIHHKQVRHLMELFWEENEEITKNNNQHPTHFPPELIVLYELVSIYEQVEAFYRNMR